MYDELVKDLRETDFGDVCVLCESELCRDKDCIILQAADAIEELSKRVDESIPKADAEIIISEVAKPRWIPATERLPEEYKDVLCYYEYFRYGDYNCMFRTIDRGYYGDGIWGGEAGQGHKNKVLAWMPLPQPPKEETT